MTIRTITAMFDDRAEAERAVEALVTTVGLDRSAVRVEPGSGATTASGIAEDKGFFASLKDLFVPDEDHHAYAEGLRRGSVLVTAQVEEVRVDRAMDILEQHGAVDLDQREAEWRKSGWAGGADAAGTGAMHGMASARATDTLQGEEVIPILEERLRVGKREVNRGRVRVRSYVVETPVEEQVTLRDEHLDVERRAVERPVNDGDRLFEERTIEATETDEEAVIAKEVRVKEELVIRKDAEDKIQTVRDKVRHTEVEIDDDRRAAGTTTGPASTENTTTGTARTPDRDRI
jgi:stress response protein YsnF